MNALLLLLIGSLPLLLAPLAGWRHAGWLLVIAPLPALLAAAVLPVGSSVTLPWLLLGTQLGLDETGRLFLLFSALLWLTASLFTAGRRAHQPASARYRLLFLLAMSGNLGLIVAQDMVSFYLGFTLMGLAAYGLVAHRASRRARNASTRYLAWTIAGELLLFVAIVMLAAQNGGAIAFGSLTSNPPAGLVVGLLVLAFGIKLALPGLHLWLPQTYAVTPAPAAAVLSGAMIKAGLLGWLRFLPPGDAALAGWGEALMVAGVTGIFFGAIVGLLQRRPRLLLGYSSISKMGVLTTGMGAALAWPAAAPALVGALGIYAAHHALVKGGLFLGLSLVEDGGLRPWVLMGLGFLAFALAGAPLTSGALAKSVLTSGLPEQAAYLVALLAASAFATTLLMARFLLLLWNRRRRLPSACAPQSATAWLALLLLIAVFPFAMADTGQLSANALPVSLATLLAPLALLAAGRLSARVVARRRRAAADPVALRYADAVRRPTRAAGRVFAMSLRACRNTCQSAHSSLVRRLRTRHPLVEGAGRWPLAGSLWLTIGGLLLAAFVSTA